MFESRILKQAQSNFPVDEQYLGVVVHPLKTWRLLLMILEVNELTDHESLHYFPMQTNLKQEQASWVEVLANHYATCKYIPGESNGLADGLSKAGA